MSGLSGMSGMSMSGLSGMSTLPTFASTPLATENSCTSPASGIEASIPSPLPAIAAPASPAAPAMPAAPAAAAPPEIPDPLTVESPSTVTSPAPVAAPAAPAPITALRFAFTVATSQGWLAPPGSKAAAFEPSGWLPASLKPAASAADGESNHTSALVCWYPEESGRWYFCESTFPLIG